MKPLLSYYGGKQRIASRIVEEINQIPHTVYVEPYAGGSAVLFAKPRRVVRSSSHYREVVNDTSDVLITLYRVAVERPAELALKLEATLYSQSDYKRAGKILQNSGDYEDLEIAWAYFVQANCSFAHILGSGWRTAAISQNEAQTWLSRIQKLKQKLDRLQGVHVSCEDAIRCIDRWDSPASLFYCDPPYPGTNQGHYSGFTENDWIALVDKLDSIQGSFILSNYPHSYEPKTAQIKKEIKATMSAAGRTRRDRNVDAIPNGKESGRTECLWIKSVGRSGRKDIDRLLELQQLSLSF